MAPEDSNKKNGGHTPDPKGAGVSQSTEGLDLIGPPTRGSHVDSRRRRPGRHHDATVMAYQVDGMSLEFMMGEINMLNWSI